MQQTQPTNVIELDPGKFQSGRRHRPSARKLARNVAEVHRQLSLQLQTTLELERLLGLFHDAIAQVLPTAGLTFTHAPTEAKVELGGAGLQAVSYRLTHAGENLGELGFNFLRRPDELELHQLEALMPCLLFPLRNALLYRAAVRNALRDPLTGAGNRVAMDQALSREIELARRHGQPLSLIMLDLDHFKTVNDRFGHQCGDEVLREVAQELKAQMRNVDMVFRFGGEEFLILLSNTPAEAAAVVGQRLCEAVEAMRFVGPEGRVPLSVSLGCATYRTPESLDSLLGRADAALYQAKRNGRNQLRMAI